MTKIIGRQYFFNIGISVFNARFCLEFSSIHRTLMRTFLFGMFVFV